MKKTTAFLTLLASLLLLGACAGTETAPAAPAGNGPAQAPEVVVYLSPT